MGMLLLAVMFLVAMYLLGILWWCLTSPFLLVIIIVAGIIGCMVDGDD